MIKKFIATDVDKAQAKARKSLGSHVVIVGIRDLPSGDVEVTAADETGAREYYESHGGSQDMGSGFQSTADNGTRHRNGFEHPSPPTLTTPSIRATTGVVMSAGPPRLQTTKAPKTTMPVTVLTMMAGTGTYR